MALNIAIIRKECGRHKGGAERYCYTLCRELLAMGHRIYLVSEWCEHDLRKDVKWLRVKSVRLNSVTKNLSFHQQVQRLLRDLKGVVSYSLSRTWPVDVFRVTDPLHLKMEKIKYASVPGKIWKTLSPRHRVLRHMESSVLSRAGSRYIVTISKLDKKLVQEFYNVPDERIRVIYNGVDQDLFSPLRTEERENARRELGLKAGETCYLFAAMDFKRKGLSNLLSALGLLDSSWKLFIAGKDNEKPYISQIKRLGLKNRVEFLGRRSDMRKLYGAADLFVFPTTYDPFGNVHLEALSCGLPVVTTRQAGGSEVVIEKRTGYVIEDSSDVEGLARVLRHYETQKRNWPEWRQRARDSVLSFTTRKNAKDTAELLEHVAQEKIYNNG